MTTEARIVVPALNSMEKNLCKGKSAPANVVDIRKSLLKLVDYETPPEQNNKTANNTLSCSQSAPRVWWPVVKRAFGSTRTAVAPREFEIPHEDLALNKKIGEGLHCNVFEGRVKSVRRHVAVKQLRSGFDPAGSASLMKDFKFLSCSLRHPAIVDFIGVSLSKEYCTVNLVFEYMGGGTLEDYFEARWDRGDVSRIPLSQALDWGMQLFSGLRFLHERDPPIILRDLKPSSLMLSADLKTLKMQDFGVSKVSDMGIIIFGKKNKTGYTKSVVKTDLSRLAGPSRKGFTGTARYMAPELDTSKMSEAQYTAAADVYSGSLILWLLLEGERPWEKHHGHVAHALAKTGRRPPLLRAPAAPPYPAHLATLIAACWAHDPRERPTAEHVESRIGRLVWEVAASPGCAFAHSCPAPSCA